MSEIIDEKEPDASKEPKQLLLPERIPAPTVWPITVALGATLLAFGILTHYILSIAGFALFVLGAGGWFEDLRNDQLQ
jgi:hypothetical protein